MNHAIIHLLELYFQFINFCGQDSMLCYLGRVNEKTVMTLKPIKTVVPFQEFKDRVASGGWLVQRKYDGIFRAMCCQLGDCHVDFLTEYVIRKSGFQGSDDDRNILHRYWAFLVPLTLVAINKQSFLTEPNDWRFERLQSLLAGYQVLTMPGQTVPVPIIWPETFKSFNPPSCFTPVGEGLVGHQADGPWGSMLCVKNRQDFLVRAMAFPGGRSVVQVEETNESMLARQSTTRASGTVPVSTKIACQIVPGMILKVTALGLTDRGLLREAKLDNDTETSWLVSMPSWCSS
jgi:hypothetical protein